MPSATPADDLRAIAPVVILGHDLGNVLVRPGSATPAMALHGEFERLVPGSSRMHGIRTHADFEAARDDILSARTILINGLGFYETQPFRVFLETVPGRSVFSLLHETAFAIEASEKRHPRGAKLFWRNLPLINVLFSTARQAEWLRSQTECPGTVVYNAILVPGGLAPLPPRPTSSRPRIVNVATVQERKGPRLFDAVATLAAEQGLDIEFTWIGRRTTWIEDDFTFSEHVDWIDHLAPEQVMDLLAGSDVFFLSSVDDPLPLSVTEAAHRGCRIVTYTEPGSNEVFSGLKGYEAFERYEPDAALDAILRVLEVPVSDIDFSGVIDDFSPARYAERVLRAMARDHASAIYPGIQSAYEWVRPFRTRINDLIDAGRLDDAERRIAFLFRATEDFEPAEVLKARLALARGDVEEAIRAARRGAELNPKSWMVYQLLGDLLVAKGDRVAAATSYAASMNCGGPTSDTGKRLRDTIRMALDELESRPDPLDELRPRYAELSRLSWFEPEIPHRYALRLKAAGHLHETLSQLTWATRLGPTRTRAHLDRGLVAEALGYREVAQAAFRRALDLNPNSSAAQTGLRRVSAKRLFGRR
jgi:glycosyltransferase involved in cell wall biosynthesis